jgi:hypothetical protein
VTITLGAPTRAIPPSFLGVSIEDWGAETFERHGAMFARALSLLRVRGGGPLLIRVGGNSADRTFWNPTGHRLPRWAFGVTPAFFRATARLLEALGARVILDLNLATAAPEVAVRVAAAAARLLPHGSIAAFEIGNEPDRYRSVSLLRALSRASGGGDLDGWEMSPSRYVGAFSRFARLLAQIAPTVPLAGPALGFPRRDVSWVAALLAAPHPRLRVLSGHVYPSTACAPKRSAAYPSVAGLLSDRASAGVARLIEPAVGLARRAGLQFRLTELGSASCGGVPGVSDSFASALWSPAAMFELLRAGADGINVHIRAEAVNGAFAISRAGQLVARPLLYGMILFDRTIGAGGRLLSLREVAGRSLHVAAWAVRGPGHVSRLLLLDEGTSSARVVVHLRTPATATTQRLLAPSIDARSGVTLDGQSLGGDGRWRGEPADQMQGPTTRLLVTLAPYSAALVAISGGS